jgi:hypothetical protein
MHAERGDEVVRLERTSSAISSNVFASGKVRSLAMTSEFSLSAAVCSTVIPNCTRGAAHMVSKLIRARKLLPAGDTVKVAGVGTLSRALWSAPAAASASMQATGSPPVALAAI